MLCNALPIPLPSIAGCKNSARILLAFTSAIANHGINFSVSSTQLFPLISVFSSTAASVISEGLLNIFSFTEFLTICICPMSFFVAILLLIFRLLLNNFNKPVLLFLL